MSTSYTNTYPASGYASETQLRNEFDKVQTALEEAVSKSGEGTGGNAMTSDLSMDGNSVINAGNISSDSLTVGGVNLSDVISETAEAAASASSSALEASVSASSSDNSAVSAAASASSALESENNSSASEANASASESNAASSELAASNSASAAEASEAVSTTKASEASASAASSANSATLSEDAKALAQASGNYIGEWSSLIGSVAAGVSVAHLGKYWGSLVAIADVTLSEPGTSSDWQSITGLIGTVDRPSVRIEDAMWSWWARPSLIRHNDKLYGAFTSQDGSLFAFQYDYVTGESKRRLLTTDFVSDDHNNGSVVVDDTQVSVYFPGRRSNGAKNAVYYWVSSDNDISNLGQQQLLTTSSSQSNYPNTYQYDSSTLLFYRGESSSNAWYSRVGSFPVNTWSQEVEFFAPSFTWPYLATRRSRKDGAQINIAIGWHPENEAHANIYVGTVHGDSATPWDVKSNGVTIGNFTSGAGFPLDESAFELAVSSTNKTRLFEVHDECLAFAEYTGDGSDAVYKYATKATGSWVVHDIVSAGSALHNSDRQYYGGVTIADNDPATVYVSREDGGGWIVEEYNTPDDGVTFNLVRTIDSGPEKKGRPLPEVKALGSTDDPSVDMLYWKGRYNTHDFTSFSTAAVNDPSTPPALIDGEFLAPGESVSFSDISEHFDIPVRIPEAACHFRVDIYYKSIGTPSTKAILLQPNGVSYAGEFRTQLQSAVGGQQDIRSSLTSNGITMVPESGTVFSATVDIYYSGASEHKLARSSAQTRFANGDYAVCDGSYAWINTTDRWETIGRVFARDGLAEDNKEINVTVTRVL